MYGHQYYGCVSGSESWGNGGSRFLIDGPIALRATRTYPAIGANSEKQGRVDESGAIDKAR